MYVDPKKWWKVVFVFVRLLKSLFYCHKSRIGPHSKVNWNLLVKHTGCDTGGIGLFGGFLKS